MKFSVRWANSSRMAKTPGPDVSRNRPTDSWVLRFCTVAWSRPASSMSCAVARDRCVSATRKAASAATSKTAAAIHRVGPTRLGAEDAMKVGSPADKSIVGSGCSEPIAAPAAKYS